MGLLRYPSDPTRRTGTETHPKSAAPESCVIVCKPTVSACPHAVERVIEVLASHGVTLQHHLKISGGEVKSRRIFEGQYSTLHHFACICPAQELELTANEQKQFRTTFAGLTWREAIDDNAVFNAVEVCEALRIEPKDLSDAWERAEAKVRLRKGLYIARLDRNCAGDGTMKKKLYKPYYMVNGFYPALEAQYCAPTATTHALICDWDGSKTSWAQLMSSVIGSTDPAGAADNSVRGTLFREWAHLGMASPSDLWHNGVHASASAFEGLVERLRWKKGAMLYTDPLGSRLLGARIKSTQIAEWTHNPIINGRPLFDQLQLLSSADCVDYLLKLVEPASITKK